MKEALFIEMELTNGDWYDNHDINSLSFRFEIETKICDFDNVNDDKIFNTVSTGYIPTLNDKLYFAKGVNIPRVKLKNLTKDYKIKSRKSVV